MLIDPQALASTALDMRPMVPAKDFAISRRFYSELGFEPSQLTPKIVEMRLGPFSFLLQDYYGQQWADNFAMHLAVSDVGMWWKHICDLELATRYKVRTRAPKQEDWALVAVLIDPSGVIWQISQKA